MLMGVDQRSEVRHLVAQQIPILNEWGCFDRITPGHTASEFAAIAAHPRRAPGGHSWMLARPQGQADVLTHLARGQRKFIAQVEARWRQLSPRVHAARRQLTIAV